MIIIFNEGGRLAIAVFSGAPTTSQHGWNILNMHKYYSLSTSKATTAFEQHAVYDAFHEFVKLSKKETILPMILMILADLKPTTP